MTRIADHKFDAGIGTRNLPQQRSSHLENKWTREQSKKFARVARMNSGELPAKSDESVLPVFLASIGSDEVVDWPCGARQNRVHGFCSTSLVEGNETSCFMLSRFISMTNLLWNADTQIPEFGSGDDDGMPVFLPVDSRCRFPSRTPLTAISCGRKQWED
jgi:hypothetical protein